MHKYSKWKDRDKRGPKAAGDGLQVGPEAGQVQI